MDKKQLADEPFSYHKNKPFVFADCNVKYIVGKPVAPTFSNCFLNRIALEKQEKWNVEVRIFPTLEWRAIDVITGPFTLHVAYIFPISKPIRK